MYNDYNFTVEKRESIDMVLTDGFLCEINKKKKGGNDAGLIVLRVLKKLVFVDFLKESFPSPSIPARVCQR
jgi:hypothetical protein